MYYIWRCILFSAFGGRIHPLNQVHRQMCIYLGIIKLIRIKRQFKSTLNSQKLEFRQISYTLNIIRSQYNISKKNYSYYTNKPTKIFQNYNAGQVLALLLETGDRAIQIGKIGNIFQGNREKQISSIS